MMNFSNECFLQYQHTKVDFKKRKATLDTYMNVNKEVFLLYLTTDNNDKEKETDIHIIDIIGLTKMSLNYFRYILVETSRFQIIARGH
jgi:hypothetical protein